MKEMKEITRKKKETQSPKDTSVVNSNEPQPHQQQQQQQRRMGPKPGPVIQESKLERERE